VIAARARDDDDHQGEDGDAAGRSDNGSATGEGAAGPVLAPGPIAARRPVRFSFRERSTRDQKQLFTGRKLWITLDRPENLVTILNGRTQPLPVGGVEDGWS